MKYFDMISEGKSEEYLENSNYILNTKNQIPNYDLSTAVIYKPCHLSGAEVTTSIFSAALLRVDTGTLEYLNSYDLVKRADIYIKVGESLGNNLDLKLKALIIPATKKEPNNPVPGHIVTSNVVKVNIKKGEIITYSMIEDK